MGRIMTNYSECVPLQKVIAKGVEMFMEQPSGVTPWEHPKKHLTKSGICGVACVTQGFISFCEKILQAGDKCHSVVK